MRSEHVFRAHEKVTNKFLLCKAAAKTTRCICFVSANTTDAITDAFVRIADYPCLFPTAFQLTWRQHNEAITSGHRI
jgi:hypothetical protein